MSYKKFYKAYNIFVIHSLEYSAFVLNYILEVYCVSSEWIFEWKEECLQYCSTWKETWEDMCGGLQTWSFLLFEWQENKWKAYNFN